MFFVKKIKNGEVIPFHTPGGVAGFMMGRVVTDYEVYYAAAPIDLSGPENWGWKGIERVLLGAIDKRD